MKINPYFIALQFLYKHEDMDRKILMKFFWDYFTQDKEIDPSETAWCAAFVGACLGKAEHPHTGKLTARSYRGYGIEVPFPEAQKGDIVVLSQGWLPWQGHVGFFSQWVKDGVMLLAGNQDSQVCFKTYKMSKLLDIRRV